MVASGLQGVAAASLLLSTAVGAAAAAGT